VGCGLLVRGHTGDVVDAHCAAARPASLVHLRLLKDV
jgi:hypothetical protein